MSVPIAQENERDPCPCQSPETLPDSVSRFPGRFPSAPHQHDHQSLIVDTSLEIPSGTAIPSHCGFCECIRSFIKATPQAAGNWTRKEIKSFAMGSRWVRVVVQTARSWSLQVAANTKWRIVD